MSLSSSRAENPGRSAAFAAAILLMAGGAQCFLGLAGVINDEVFAKLGGYIFGSTPRYGDGST